MISLIVISIVIIMVIVMIMIIIIIKLLKGCMNLSDRALLGNTLFCFSTSMSVNVSCCDDFV